MLKNRLCVAVVALVVGAGVVAVAPAVAAAPAAAPPVISPALPPGGSFVPVTPTRVLDTRKSGGPVTATSIPASSIPGVPRDRATAVLLNVTVVNASGAGYVVVGYGNGTSNGNYRARTASATLALVRFTIADSIPITTSARADIVVDVQGYVTTRAAATAASFTPLAVPRRAADTRSALGLTPFAAGQTQTLDVRTRAALPTEATAVVANVTVASATTATYVTGWSGVGTRPVVSTVNAGKGDIVANRALLPLDPSGRIALFNLGGRTDLVVDVVGYLSPDPTGSYYTPTAPTRLSDGTAENTLVAPTVDVATGGAVLAPSTRDLAPTTAVWLTLVGDHPSGRGYLAARPGGSAPTATSDLNLVPGRAVANAGPAAVSSTGTVAVQSSPASRVVVDLSGWFAKAPAPAAAGLWSSTRYVDYSDDPIRRDTLPTSLPAFFAGGVFLGEGTRTTTQAFAVAPDGTVRQAFHSNAQPGTVSPWSAGTSRVGPTNPAEKGYLAGVTQLASAGTSTAAATYALNAVGQVYGFLSNTEGQLGTPPNDFVTYPIVPTLVPLPLGVVATAVYTASAVGYAVGADGTIYSWGRAGTGQLGRTPTASPWVPAAVSGLTSPKAIAGDGRVTFAIDAHGATWSWGTPSGGTPVPAPTPYANSCETATALHADYNGVWELCDDGTVVQLSRLGVVSATTQTLAVSGVTAIGAGPGYDNGVRVLLTDGRVATVPTTGAARYEAGFAGVTAINGSPGVQITAVGS